MKRKEFLKKTLFGAVAVGAGTGLAASKSKSTYDHLMEPVGFNHLPYKEINTMKSVLHKAETRGHANHGWLDTHHTFSFASYYNPERVHFGVLRVLNDDIVSGGKGFPTHPHDNMEIISIPLEGSLKHKDSMGNAHIIKKNDIQVMSAGKGIRHSEYNNDDQHPVNFLQIWVFPNQKNVTPRYDQVTLNREEQANQFSQILSPNPEDEGVWIHQNAWFNLGWFDQSKRETYTLKRPGNGVYTFVIEGSVAVNGQKLDQRDGYGIWNTEQLDLDISENSEILLMEVPMSL